MNSKQVNISLTDEDYALLLKEATRLQALSGKKTSLADVARNLIKPELEKLRNGNSPPTKQVSPQDEIPPTSKNTNSFDFGDLKL